MMIDPVSRSYSIEFQGDSGQLDLCPPQYDSQRKLFYHKLMESMALQIVKEMQRHNEAMKKAWQKHF